MYHGADIGSRAENPQMHIELSRGLATTSEATAAQIHLYDVVGGEFSLEQTSGGDQCPLRCYPYRYVAIGACAQAEIGEALAVMRNASGRLALHHPAPR
jgi:hypothetical protein